MADNNMDPVDPDAALMVAFQKGDTAAFEQLLGEYHRVIVNFIYKIVNNPTEAEDLAQDVFLRIFRAKANYEPRAPFGAWIYRIAVNVSLKSIARKRFRLFGFGSTSDRNGSRTGEERVADQRPTAERALMESETARIVRGAVRTLPEREKVALILRRYEGLSYRDIAAVMNCTEAAVKTYIHRGKLHVRERVLPYLTKGLI
jgi:RNA polymerase sigma-70 factor, ECF subfamily